MNRRTEAKPGVFFGALILLGLLAALLATPLRAAEPPAAKQSFDSPARAVAALVAAVEKDGDDGLVAILGPDAEELIASGDPVADRNGRERFLQAYAEKNSLEQQDEARAILIVGDRDYPFPIPIVREAESWRFDTAAGREEILNRRIGRNELHTIEVMQVYTDAQRDFACRQRSGGSDGFARKFTSSEGARDGLYWPAAEGEEESPFGPLIARASEEGYSGGLDEDPPEPYHGYLFRILTAQGPHANGGAFDYVADGKMLLGFGLVAYPARYGVSGVMTFIVNQAGIIYEKDLGAETSEAATAMNAFDPDGSWHKYVAPNAD